MSVEKKKEGKKREGEKERKPRQMITERRFPEAALKVELKTGRQYSRHSRAASGTRPGQEDATAVMENKGQRKTQTERTGHSHSWPIDQRTVLVTSFLRPVQGALITGVCSAYDSKARKLRSSREHLGAAYLLKPANRILIFHFVDFFQILSCTFSLQTQLFMSDTKLYSKKKKNSNGIKRTETQRQRKTDRGGG